MNGSSDSDFARISKAILFLKENRHRNPSLSEIASTVHLSPEHFQKLFYRWAGVSPKQFVQSMKIDAARELLRSEQLTLSETSASIGLSTTSRLHDLFIHFEAMTPAEFRSGGKGLIIEFAWCETLFGTALIASTERGICYLGFHDTKNGFHDLQMRYPMATFQENQNHFHAQALLWFQRSEEKKNIRLHIYGTAFQVQVWQALLRIPEGNLATYGQIAKAINRIGSSRAVGSAVGHNPISFLIPCHRVIRQDGTWGQYHWGEERKTQMILWEAEQAITFNQQASL